MNAESWIRLFRHIPLEHQSKFTLITSNGTEMSVQNFIRIEPEFLLVKGRLSGSQDAGRVFFIPYENIDSFSYTNPVRDSDVEELFGALAFDAPAPAQPPPPALPPMPAPQPVRRSSHQGQVPGASPSRLNIRSEVLERFRNSRTESSSLNLPRPNLEDEGS